MLSTHVPASVFLSHASEDNTLVQRIAEALHKNGITTFFDQEDITSGDSIRQKIDEAIKSCSHFVPVLTPASKKPWVNIEIDAAISRMVKQKTRVIPLVFGLSDEDIPPTLATTKWLRIDESLTGIDDLINYIQPAVKGRGIKPALPNPLVGRDNEIEELVSSLVDRQSGPVAVTGGPGMGKTTICAKILEEPRVAQMFSRIFLVDLAHANMKEEVLQALAAALEVPVRAFSKTCRIRLAENQRC